jgi:hypothetical protein
MFHLLYDFKISFIVFENNKEDGKENKNINTIKKKKKE